jgi:hypothetical protein
MSSFAVMNRRRRRTVGRDRVYLAPARGRKGHPILAIYPMRVYPEATRPRQQRHFARHNAIGGCRTRSILTTFVLASGAGTFAGVPSASPAMSERGIEIGILGVEPDGARLAELLDLAASGVLELRVAGRVPLAEAASAYGKVAGGGQRGRWLLVP